MHTEGLYRTASRIRTRGKSHRSNRKSDENDDGSDNRERNERFRKECYRFPLLAVEVHLDRVEKERIAHKCHGEDEEAKRRHRRENSIGFLSDEGRPVRNDQNDQNDIQSGDERVEIRILSHHRTIASIL